MPSLEGNWKGEMNLRGMVKERLSLAYVRRFLPLTLAVAPGSNPAKLKSVQRMWPRVPHGSFSGFNSHTQVLSLHARRSHIFN